MISFILEESESKQLPPDLKALDLNTGVPPKSVLLPRILHTYDGCECRVSYNGKNRHATLNLEM